VGSGTGGAGWPPSTRVAAPGDPLAQTVATRLSVAEYEDLRERAKAANLAVASFLRQLLRGLLATTIPGKANGIPGMATTIPARHPIVVAFRLESVVAFDRNRWSPSTGICNRDDRLLGQLGAAAARSPRLRCR
jgi:hypothetical protein